MKKALAALWVMCLMVCFCMPVSAAPGGVYRIEEMEMSITIPQDWTVLTRNVAADDADVQRYGGYDLLMQDMGANSIYLIAVGTNNEALMVSIVDGIEEFSGAKSLSEIYAEGNTSAWPKYLDSMEKGALSQGAEFLGVYESDATGKTNNYLYIHMRSRQQGMEIQGYATFFEKSLITFSMYRVDGGELTQSNQATFQRILSSVHYDNQRTIEEWIMVNPKVTATVGKPSSAGSRFLVTSLSVLILSGIVALFSFIKKKTNALIDKKQGFSAKDRDPVLQKGQGGELWENMTESQAAQSFAAQPHSEESLQETEDEKKAWSDAAETKEAYLTANAKETSIADEPEAVGLNEEQMENREVVCGSCGVSLPQDSAFCMKCGTKTK